MRVVLITQQGSGSNLLRSLLNSHSDIFFANEILTKSEEYQNYQKKYSIDAPKKYINNFFNKDRPEKVIGFDLKYNNISPEPQILDYLKENKDIVVIHLYRCKGRTFMRDMNEKNKATLSYGQFQEHLKWMNKWQELIEKEFNIEGRKYIRINYEEMTRGYEIEELPHYLNEELCKFLKVDNVKLTKSKEQVRENKLKMRY